MIEQKESPYTLLKKATKEATSEIVKKTTSQTQPSLTFKMSISTFIKLFL